VVWRVVVKELPLGATYLGDGRTGFNVWSPLSEKAEVRLVEPEERIVLLEKDEWGYFKAVLESVTPGALYFYMLDGEKERPDPASRSQPRGVHGPSEVADQAFEWADDGWFNIPLRDYVIYELHVGTFTSEGTFEAIIPYLDYLKDMGVTAVEIMPVAQFPGGRNWGYDGVYPFAVQDSYGGIQGFKRLVDACHQKGLAVVLDVVYNHLGPEGSYMSDFGPYFTERYRTPWGAALNFDGPHSGDVKRYFIENALYWLSEFHIDAFRLDAVHAILDYSPLPFVEELGAVVRDRATQLNRRVYLIAESDANDARLITSRALGGYGMDAQWSDDFHHCVHALLTGERDGYYQDYGRVGLLASAFRNGYAYTGQHSPYRRRRHGSPSRSIPAERFTVCVQNHDQVGNRMLGERLSQLVSFEQLKLAAGVMLLSPFVPLLFMGEEYGEIAPFQYFISHTDLELVKAVQLGRAEEFAAFVTSGEPPDPYDEATFLRCKLDHSLREKGHYRVLLDFYKELIRLRNETSALSRLDKDSLDAQAYEKHGLLLVRRWSESGEMALAFNFGGALALTVPLPEGRWDKALDSAAQRWNGPGSPAPEGIVSDGEVRLDLAPQSFVMLALK
jgi:maltooligosyltrehalose trehalohydrolase